MPPRNSPLYTVIVATVLCLVCSAVVSVFAVGLRGWQEENKAIDKKKNVLRAAGKNLLVDVGVIDKEASNNAVTAAFDGLTSEKVNEIFADRIVKHYVDIGSGEIVATMRGDEGDESQEASPKTSSDDALPEGFDPATYDALKASKNPELWKEVTAGALPGIQHREPYAEVYEIRKADETDGFVFPIYGKGLWSTLYGFLAVEADGETVRGITFYQHAETPGLGGEVDNSGWKALWAGKKLYENEGEVTLSVIKGAASSDDDYAVDGLSGATITSKGVDNMIKYWLGPDAFGQFLAKQSGAKPSEKSTASVTPAKRLAAK